MKELFGNTIADIYIDDSKTYLVFIEFWYRQAFTYYAAGECCSDSWFESITNPENIIGEEITGIEVKTFTNEYFEKVNNQGDYESLQLFGYTLKTTSP